MRWRGIASACLAEVLALTAMGCGGHGSYRVAVSFDTGDGGVSPSDVSTIELMLVDQCPSAGVVASGTAPSAGIVSRIVLLNGAKSLPTFGNVSAGTYGLYARGIDGKTCVPKAAACVPVSLAAGGSNTLTITLSPLDASAPGTSICTNSDICVHGECSSIEGSCTSQSADGSACTDDAGFHGLCESGQCIVTCVDDDDCNDGNPCNGLETCNTSNGTCRPGTPLMCDDGNPCNGTETCVAGVGCQPGSPPDCNDGNPCTTDACDPSSGCTHTPVQGGPACTNSLGNSGICQNGFCVVPCSTNADCDDGNVCNGTETCDLTTHTCQAGTPLVCNDGNPCNGVETCDPTMGCMPGTPLNCNDNNPCTNDTCDPTLGCQNTVCPLGCAPPWWTPCG